MHKFESGCRDPTVYGLPGLFIKSPDNEKYYTTLHRCFSSKKRLLGKGRPFRRKGRKTALKGEKVSASKFIELIIEETWRPKEEVPAVAATHQLGPLHAGLAPGAVWNLQSGIGTASFRRGPWLDDPSLPYFRTIGYPPAP